ncbi:MAG: pyridoxal phosphate-dependent aminotransferase [Longimicrobiales bacterium]|nr:pyridoxal phosphate-dependent aminotransferase [Longimicrobiales bacterium]
MAAPAVARRLREGQLKKSPIREIMKLADRRNIVAMGLDPDDVISFAGGWVNHEAPEALRREYAVVADDPTLFHELGAYSPTRGLPRLRDALLAVDAALYGTPGLADEHLLVGGSSTQLTHTLFTALLDPGDRVVLFDPSYANYGPQLNLGPEGTEILWLPVFDADTWAFMPDAAAVVEAFEALVTTHQPRLMLFSSPDNPTSQLIRDDVFDDLLAIAERAGCFVVVDFAYRAQCFADTLPKHFSASPATHPNLIRLHSNSKWCRGLGRRLGWVEAAPHVIDALEVVQQSTALCPDSVHQHALAAYLERALPDGSLEAYMDETNRLYAQAGRHTVECIDRYLGMPRLDPEGGLYTVMDVGRDGDDFVRDVLPKTGVIFVPGSGFGTSLTNGVRISYGPLVNDLDRIEEGFRRVGEVVPR